MYQIKTSYIFSADQTKLLKGISSNNPVAVPEDFLENFRDRCRKYYSKLFLEPVSIMFDFEAKA